MNEFIAVIITILVLGILKTILNITRSRCKHHWEIIKEGTKTHTSGPLRGATYGIFFISKCTECGKLKREDF